MKPQISFNESTLKRACQRRLQYFNLKGVNFAKGNMINPYSTSRTEDSLTWNTQDAL